MAQAGAPQHIIDAEVAALVAQGDDGSVSLWPEHVAPVQALHACGTQWRMAGSLAGISVTGLDYAACDVALRRSGLELQGQAFADFQTLESFAAALLNGKKPEELRS